MDAAVAAVVAEAAIDSEADDAALCSGSDAWVASVDAEHEIGAHYHPRGMSNTKNSLTSGEQKPGMAMSMTNAAEERSFIIVGVLAFGPIVF